MGIQLAGCSFLPNADAPSTAPARSAPPVSSGKPVKPPASASASRPAPVKPGSKAPANPEELVGLDEDGVRKLLGSPANTRNDGAARILTYRTSRCALDVILFFDVNAGNLRVLSYQLDEGRARPAVDKRCYGEFRGAQ